MGKQLMQGTSFSVFGCGNRLYGSSFNVVGRHVNASLKKLGAKRIVEMHVGDEDKGNIERQFLKWRNKASGLLAVTMGVLNTSCRF